MKKILLAVILIVITTAFEQKASVHFRSIKKVKPNTIEVVDQLDTLSKKFEKFNHAHKNEK